MFVRLLFLVMIFAVAAPSSAQEPPKTPAKKAALKIRPDQAPGYEPLEIEGFTVLFSKEAWKHREDPAFELSPLKVLEGELKAIVGMMPVKSVNILRNLAIWVEWDDRVAMSNGRAGSAVAVYYGGHQLNMLAKGMPALQANTVTILRMKALTEEHQPKRDSGRCVLLHEIAHAVHHQLLGRENPVVAAAYKQAMERKLLDREAYAATNEAEFFAEMSCAYFNQLDYFPRNRSDLLKHDPVTHKMMEGVWGKTKIAGPAKTSPGAVVSAPALAELQWGQPVVGPPVSAVLAADRPTVVLYWNAANVSSLSALSKAAVWEAELRDFGLCFAAVHLTGQKGQDVKGIAEERNLTYSITNDRWTQFSIVDDFKDFPVCLVYKNDGTCIYRGSPFDAEASARVAVGEALVASAGLAEPPKALEAIVDTLKKGKAPATVYPRLAFVVKSKDEDAAKAAKTLLEKLTETGQKVVAENEAKIKDQPLDAFLALERVAVTFKDTPVGFKANEHLNRLRQTKVVALELKARPALAAIKKADAELSSRPGAFDPLQPAFRRDNVVALRQLELAVQQMRQAHPMARATEQAKRIAERYGLQ